MNLLACWTLQQSCFWTQSFNRLHAHKCQDDTTKVMLDCDAVPRLHQLSQDKSCTAQRFHAHHGHQIITVDSGAAEA